MPAAVLSTDNKEEDKTGATTPTEKSKKRSSVFGSIFNKKNVTSPTTEKTEAEAATPAKDTEIPPVSETAPKIEEPIATKPIDAAAVTAPTSVEPAKEDAPVEPTPAPESPPKTEKKPSFLTGLIKKVEGKKEEPKEEKVVEPTAPVEGATPAAVESTDGTTETPVVKEERPAREKRRTSLFGSLGTLKKKTEKKEDAAERTEDVNGTETNREKSPLPTKLGGLFRKPSKAVKSDAPTEPAAEPVTETKETSAAEPVVAPETTESKIVGDVVPADLHTTPVAPEVKATA